MIRKLSVLALLATTAVKAQETGKSYVMVSGEAGIVLNSEESKTFGLGGTVAYMMPDKLFNKKGNYITIGLKGYNNPYKEGEFVSSIWNNKNDGLNYISLLLGYRMPFNTIENGVYVEPRAGLTRAAFFTGLIVAPKVGYTYNKWDFSLFTDFAVGGPNNNLGKSSFISAGASIGYFFDVSKKKEENK